MNGFDQNGAQFLAQVKPFLQGLMSWLSEEGNEPEHPMGGAPAAADDNTNQPPPPALVRTRTTTVADYTPTPMATDPPVSQAQRAAMHAAAGGNSTLGIPQSVGREFANADPGGKLPATKNSNDANNVAEGRFALTPDGKLTDSHTGMSYGMNDVMRILFGGGTPQDAGVSGVNDPAKVNVARPQTATGTWRMPKFNSRQSETTAPTQATVSSTRDNGPGEGAGGKALGQLLKYTAGDTTSSASGGGNSASGGGIAKAATGAIGAATHGVNKLNEGVRKATELYSSEDSAIDCGPGWKAPKFG